MKKSNLAHILFFIVAAIVATACEDTTSYAELLEEQDKYVNNFLTYQQVILEVPEDTIFISGPDAPYYALNDDHTLYMQVLNPGTKGNMVSNDEQIYFRYTRYALASFSNGKLPAGSGNNITLSPAWFRYGNYSLTSSQAWGVGVQTPLAFLPIDCEVNLIVKAEMGFTSEMADVQPYLYRLTYQRKQ